MLRRWVSPLEGWVFVYLLGVTGFFMNENPGWNVNTRIRLVNAIVEDWSLAVDSHVSTPDFATGDLAFRDGKYYCDKSPVLSFLAVPACWAYKAVRAVGGWPRDPMLLRYIASMATSTVSTAVLGVLLFRFLGKVRPDPQWQVVTVLCLSLGTLAFPYATLFMSHQTAAMLGFAGYSQLALVSGQDRPPGARRWGRRALLAGLFVGLAMATENPAGIVAFAVSSYLASQRPSRRDVALYALGAVAGAAVTVPYNWACFGGPFRSGYEFEIHAHFRNAMARGLMGITSPDLRALAMITVLPYRGLLFQSPFLLAAVPGFLRLWRQADLRRETLLCVGIVVAFLLFNSSYFAWDGGWTIGPRHLIPMLPFLAVGVYAAPRWGRPVVSVLGALSAGVMSAVCLTDPQVSKVHWFPLRDFTLPNLIHGNFSASVLSYAGVPRVTASLVWVALTVLAGSLLIAYAGRTKIVAAECGTQDQRTLSSEPAAQGDTNGRV